MAAISPVLSSSLNGALARAAALPATLAGKAGHATAPGGAAKTHAAFADVLLLHSLTQGANLVGKTVLYNPAGASQVKKGQVNSVNVDNGTVSLSVNGTKIALSQVRGVVAT
jgi:hypothetical protein